MYVYIYRFNPLFQLNIFIKFGENEIIFVKFYQKIHSFTPSKSLYVYMICMLWYVWKNGKCSYTNNTWTL